MAYNPVMDLLARVRVYIEEQALWRPGEAVVVGVSGGPDSVCLLDLLHRLAQDWRMQLHVAHLNHGLRAHTEAVAEAALVRLQAETLGLPFQTETADVRAYAAQHKQSIEEAARNCRYEFLARVARSVEAACVAVAHTADDQAETVLMHILRGSGLAGLRGMLPKTARGDPSSVIQVIRPLLQVSRAEVETYCAERGLQPVRDPSNTDVTFFRNRLRHELLPDLETYNPNIRAVLGRMAEVAAGEHDLLEHVITDLWKRVVLAEGLAVEFRRERWLALSVPEQRALLRRAIHRLRANERDVDFTPLEHAVRFTHRAGPGRSCEVLAGLRLKITAEALILQDDAYHPVRTELPLLIDGQLPADWRFDIERLPLEVESFAQRATHPNAWQTWVDADRLEGRPLRLRARRPGERFQPLGLNGHSLKLSDFFINTKIDESVRDRWPLVVCGDDIVWVVGLRLDERFKVTPATKLAWRLSMTKVA